MLGATTLHRMPVAVSDRDDPNSSGRLDVHARSVAAAAIDGVKGAPVKATQIPSHEHICLAR